MVVWPPAEGSVGGVRGGSGSLWVAWAVKWKDWRLLGWNMPSAISAGIGIGLTGPFILPSPLKEKVNKHNVVEAHCYAHQCRRIDCEQIRSSLQVDSEIVQLMSTAVKISDNLYGDKSKRSPRQILQLYNCCWLHHELSHLIKYQVLWPSLSSISDS